MADPPLDNPDDGDDGVFEEGVADEVLLEACKQAEASSSSSSKPPPPLLSFRHGYLWVSDISRQLWCEQQLHYSFSRPDLLGPKAPEMTRGTEMHLTRELETQDYVDVETTSNEDIFAVKLFNFLMAMRGLASGAVAVSREVPIFGPVVTGRSAKSVFFLGKIDELRIEDDGKRLVLSEFKTRKAKRLPGQAQRITHDVQVMLYKYLLDAFVRGDARAEDAWEALSLDPERKLGEGMRVHVSASSADKCQCLADMWRAAAAAAQCLILVSKLRVEYCHQQEDDGGTKRASGDPFAVEEVEYDESWLLERLSRCGEYWYGERGARGVEVEEAWKCANCDFEDVCQWRKSKIDELAKQNMKKK